jgi:hypothetical protein
VEGIGPTPEELVGLATVNAVAAVPVEGHQRLIRKPPYDRMPLLQSHSRLSQLVPLERSAGSMAGVYPRDLRECIRKPRPCD